LNLWISRFFGLSYLYSAAAFLADLRSTPPAAAISSLPWLPPVVAPQR